MAANVEKQDLTDSKIPDQKTIDAAGECEIQDVDGKKIKFSSLYTGAAANERQLIVFIRHFFCGFCEDYVRALAQDLSPSELATSSTRLTIIGCGESVCVPDYKQRTGCPFEIYCDPSRKLYDLFGMQVNLRAAKTPEYLRGSMFSMVVRSTVTALSSFRKAMVSGKASQNGGEMIFVDGRLVWMHIMKDTADHTEVPQLKKQLAVAQ